MLVLGGKIPLAFIVKGYNVMKIEAILISYSVTLNLRENIGG